MLSKSSQAEFVQWFRHSSPYIRAFHGRTFVVTIGGEVLADAQFASLVHDFALLNSLGIRLVLVHGARPQIEARLKEAGAKIKYVNGLRVTDDFALACVKQAAGSVRVEIEALLSMGLSHSPLIKPRDKSPIRVVSGNFVTAQPLGVVDGIDYLHTGEVRSIDVESINWHLEDGNIVLLSPMGYSPTGETFNLSAEDIATATAKALNADKLILFTDRHGVIDENNETIRELTQKEAIELVNAAKQDEQILHNLKHAVDACQSGVPRVHIINRHTDGALLLELFTRDGIGTLISAESFEDTRQATIEDVGGILALIEPMEQEGILVRRSREHLEMEIDHFIVVERDGLIIACAALYPYTQEKVAELACLAVHPEYRDQGRGDRLFNYLIKQVKQLGIERLFVLTTRTSHWFLERGFSTGQLDELPVVKRELYNYQRNSKVFFKDLNT